MAVAVIGLGIMGGAYARNLVRAGERVIGVDPSEAARAAADAQGVTSFPSLGSWVADCDLILLSLISPAILAEVVQSLKPHLRSGQILLETGTFALADKLAAEVALAGVGAILLDCPVSGTGAQAATGDLVMMASGPGEAIEKARPYMEKFTRMVMDAGPFGNGTKLKFVANHAVAVHNAAAAETLNYADALGLDRATVFTMLSSGAGQSRMSDLRMPLMISGAYEPPSASLKMFEKDLSVIGADIAEKSVKAPLFAATTALYDQAFAELSPGLDTAAIFEVYRRHRP